MPIEQSQVLLGGAVVFWRLAARSDRQKLSDALEHRGLGRFCPDVRTNASALKEALADYSNEIQRRVMIRGLKNPERDGYLVVNETLGETDNNYDKLFSCKVNESGLIEIDPINFPPDLSRIETLFAAHKTVVTGYAVAKLMVDLVGYYRGTPLRPQGGFYWVESSVLPDLIAVSSAIEQCAIGESSAIHFIRTAVDNLSVRALRDAIVNEVTQKAQEIETAAKKPGLQKRALEARQTEAQLLHDRVAYFEGLLGEALTELHQVAERAETQVVEHALQTIPDFLSGLGELSAREVA